MPADAVHITIMLTSGERLEKHVEHAIGSIERPMTHADLAAKFTDLVEPILGGAHAARLLEAGWKMESLENIATLADMARPVEKT
jgi:2-methylcitrate dehydratase PrpD